MYSSKYDIDNDFQDMNNRLLCTFVDSNGLDNLITDISKNYDIMYRKIFVLYIKSNDEFAITYNIEQGNVNSIPANTILVHRKKESNTLYTINALNDLIKKLNNGEIDPTYKIEWQNYRNCILLTQQGEIKQLNTKIYKIVDL